MPFGQLLQVELPSYTCTYDRVPSYCLWVTPYIHSIGLPSFAVASLIVIQPSHVKLVITIAPSLEVVSLVKPLELKLTLQQIMEYIYTQNVPHTCTCKRIKQSVCVPVYVGMHVSQCVGQFVSLVKILRSAHLLD